jgi:kumamolisin
MTDTSLIALAGSTRSELDYATEVGPIDGSTRIELTVFLRRRAELPQELIEGPETITRQELAEQYGAHPDDLDRLRELLTGDDIQIVDSDLGARRVRVSGTIRALTAAFDTSVALIRSPDPVTGESVEHRYRSGHLGIPAELDGIVEAVVGLDTRPQARTQHHLLADAAPGTSYTPPQIGQIYNFPQATDGSGQSVAILELGGGFGQNDLDTYFRGLGLPTPTVRAQGVDGAQNQPGQDPQGADGEVLLDIEVIGGLAPKAQQTVYFAPNTDQGFLDVVYAAVHANPTPAALSISWGQSEDSWTAQTRNALDKDFADAAALGVTVCAAAGDRGSGDGANDGAAHVDFPASSPNVLACGGTRLQTDGTGRVISETVWDDDPNQSATGGGVSDAFPVPPWQSQAGVPTRQGGGPGRGVPDVAGNADPRSGYQILVDGQRQVTGGTSAVAPLWAALVARLNQALGRKVGLLQPKLYAGIAPGKNQPGFRDVTTGNNGAYTAGPGWDACTGLGVPDGTALRDALSK